MDKISQIKQSHYLIYAHVNALSLVKFSHIFIAVKIRSQF